MSEIHVHNGGPDALVFTRDGRIIGPHRTLPAKASDPVTARLLRCGRLTYRQAPNSAPEATPESAPETKEQRDTEQVLAEPAGNASTEDWQEYAVSQGLNEDEVADMKRDEIRELFTETTPAGGEKPAPGSTAPGGENNESEKEN